MPLRPYHPTWKPMENITISFDDKTGQARSVEQINMFFDELRETANLHGFDINTWGNDRTMYKWLGKLAG